jgi:hypothetical protein
MENEEL